MARKARLTRILCAGATLLLAKACFPEAQAARAPGVHAFASESMAPCAVLALSAVQVREAGGRTV